MTDEGVVVLGIPIPSSAPLFLSIVAVHVVAGLICTVGGIVAMLTAKRSGRHPSAGTIYYWSLLVVFLSMSALSILRWLRVHVSGMALSYILLLTAFYVDNGPNLPLWRSLPLIALWFLPSIVGLPILVWALTRHPLILRLGNRVP